jgi:hypothetical protein
MHWAFLISAIGAVIGGVIALRFFDDSARVPGDAAGTAHTVPLLNATTE